MSTFLLIVCINCADIIEHGLKILAVGDCPSLGNWNPAHGHELVFDTTDRVWKAKILLPFEGTEYKYVIVSVHRTDIDPYWEAGPNRWHGRCQGDVLEHTLFRWDDNHPLIIPRPADDGDDDDDTPWSFKFIDLTIGQENAAHTLSFQILDDLRPRYEIDVPLSGLSTNAITDAVNRIAKPFLNGEHDDVAMCRYYFDREFMDSYRDRQIVKGLQNDGYHVLNRFEKYYVYAWAIDHVRFSVHSKDCDNDTIQWSGGNGPFITPDDDEQDD